MSTLNHELRAAQQADSAQPVVEVIARHTEAGYYVPRLQQVFAGGVTDNYHAAAVTASGALIRVWTTPTNRLLVERTVINADGSPQVPFGSNWVNRGTVADTRGCAIATSGAEVLIFALATNGVDIVEFRSTDDGQTYSGPTVRFSEASAVTWMAAVSKADGRTALVWNIGATGGGTGATLRGARRSVAGTWSAAVSSGLAAGDIFGVAVLAGADFGVVVAGRTAGALAPRLWGLDFTDVSPPAWGSAVELEKAEGGLVDRYEFHAPFLLNADRQRLTYLRAFFGNVARLNDIALTSLAYPGYAVTQRKWREPTVVDTTRSYGLAIAGPGGGSYLWLTSPGRIYRAPASTVSYDLSEDVLALRASWTMDGGALDLTLNNASGEYNTLSDGTDNPFAALTVGSEIEVRLGYRMASGPQTAAALPLYRVDRVERHYAAGEHVLAVHGRDALAQLGRWRNPSQIVVGPGTDHLAEVLEQVTSRAGYAVYGNPVPLQSRTPAFTINPNETGLSIAGRIVGKVAQALVDRAGKLTLRDVPQAGPAAYAFGPSYMQEVLSEASLKAYWRLGEAAGASTAVDSSGNGYDLTVAGNPTLGAAGLLTNDPDSAMTFDGTGDWLTRGDTAGLEGMAALTVEAWVKVDPTKGGTFVSKSQPFVLVSYSLEMGTDGRVHFIVGTGGNTTISSAGGWNDGVRHHAVGTYDGANMRLYIDGVLRAGPTAKTGSIADTAMNVRVGAQSNNGSPLTGTVDEAAICVSGLSAERILAHYEAGSGTLTRERHRIAALSFGAELAEANEVLVIGADRSALARDTGSQGKAGPMLEIVYDRTNTTNATVTEHSAATLRLRAIAARAGRLTPALPNVGQELYDVITITHPGMGLVNARKRVTGVHLDYRRNDGLAGRFEQHLDLGEP